jgi:hypothetical protein
MFSQKARILSLFLAAAALAGGSFACGGDKTTTAVNGREAAERSEEESAPGEEGATTEGAGDEITNGETTTPSGENLTPAGKDPIPGSTPPPPKVDPDNPNPPVKTAADLVAKLTTALDGVRFVSEREFPWTVIEGDATGVGEITPQVVAEKLGAEIAKLEATANRNLATLGVEQDVDGWEAFLDDLASDPNDPAGPKYIATKDLFKASLQAQKVFFFDLGASGAPTITIVVGKSATNRLVAIVTFQTN